MLDSLPVHLLATCGDGMAASVLKEQLSANIPFEMTEQHKERQEKQIRRWTATIVGIVVAAMLLAIWVVSGNITLLFAFVFPLIMGPYAIYQRRRINRLPTLVQEINLCRQLVNRMHVQNNRLMTESSRLQGCVGRLDDYEKELSKWAEASGANQQELEALVKAQGQALKKMKQIQEAKELQEYLRILLAADRDNDRSLSEQEMATLQTRLQIFRAHKSSVFIDDSFLRESLMLKGASGVSTTVLFKQTTDLLAENEKKARELGFIDDTDEDAHAYWRCLD